MNSNPSSDKSLGAVTELDSLVDINNLRYYLQSDLSCVNEVRYTKNFFTNSTYSNSNSIAQCILTTGSSFVGASHLHFSVSPELTDLDRDLVRLEYGSDLLESMVIYSRQGVEISRTMNLNTLTRTLTNYRNTDDTITNKFSTWIK